MRKFILIIAGGLLTFSFTFTQTTTQATQKDANVSTQIILQNFVETATQSLTTKTNTLPVLLVTPKEFCKPKPACLDTTPSCLLPEPAEGWCSESFKTTSSLVETKVISFPKTVTPAVPLDKPITPEAIKPILSDEDREDDFIIQLKNLKITRIVTSTPVLTSDIRAIFFAVKDVGWRCLMFENEKTPKGIPCIKGVRKSIAFKELAIKITDDTILLKRNKQKAKLEDFQVNDKINVYGFMDKDNYGIEALVVKKIVGKIVSSTKSLPSSIMSLPNHPIFLPKKTQELSESPVCIQVITPAYNPQNLSECKEFSTPCNVPEGWIKTNKCPVKY